MSNNNNWTDGYVADLNYTIGYYRELSPSLLQYMLLLKGIAPPHALNEKFNYFEMGFGQGLSLNVNALTHPTGTFWGNDFNSEHVNFAEQLAKAGGTSVNLCDDSFEELLERTYPAFDYITLHGIWSWISETNKKAIVKFIRKNLKIGGAVYISYNALPGWATTMPLRQLMKYHEQASGEMGRTLEQRIREAMQFTRKLQASGAAYFKHSPTIEKSLEHMEKQPTSYLAHEYFNRDWTPMYFNEVAEYMAGAKLTFAASANLADHIPNMVVSPEMQAILDSIKQPEYRETVRDYMLNNTFRKDVFVRGARRITDEEATPILESMRFGLLVSPERTSYSFSTNARKIDLQKEIYEPIVDTLHKHGQPLTLKELKAHPVTGKLKPVFLQQALTLLASMGNLSIHSGEVASDKKTKSFNKRLAKLAETSDQIHFMVAGKAGVAVQMDRIEQLALQSANEGKTPEQTITKIWKLLKSANVRLIKDGKVLNDEKENTDHLTAIITKFYHDKLPILTAVGAST